MSKLNPEYWSERYRSNQIGWDIGEVSKPLKEYFDQLENRKLKILIPGCGRGFEGVYLWEKGFKNIFLADYSEEALNEVKKNSLSFPDENLLHADFFKLENTFDLIIEQTLFCALDPSLRVDYVSKMAELLSPKGKLVGVMFNREFDGGPPFGGTLEDYKTLFSEKLQITLMEECYNSIAPRKGHELFFIAEKK